LCGSPSTQGEDASSHRQKGKARPLIRNSNDEGNRRYLSRPNSERRRYSDLGTKGIDSTHHALQFKKRAQQLVSNKSMTLGNFTDR
jgi:hypothetical protein